MQTPILSTRLVIFNNMLYNIDYCVSFISNNNIKLNTSRMILGEKDQQLETISSLGQHLVLLACVTEKYFQPYHGQSAGVSIF